ncbi:hypothetical protein P3X46_034617 [Hevea brasiliensis]|uniref:DUF1677 family protein n=1 Tax=Hevea brasiliensis TaxID=3981 RepID=A0ABQ9K7L8_HEVBR|nr:uncharacterized protein LOC110645610 [Hevea brasiliensis]KAJ9128679.1 hypothetical protein P3X46_034617 [Hevea brasiliensis]
MVPNGETLVGSYCKGDNVHKPSRLSMEGLQRTLSDISLELSKETSSSDPKLPPISEVQDSKCECCGMSEECTDEYIKRVRGKFLGKFVCGLCAEAVQQEMEKNGGKREEALNEHMNVCVKFNRHFRVNPILHQAEAMREILKKSSSIKNRAKSISPRDSGSQRKGGIARSSSCIPAIYKNGDQPLGSD